MRRTGKKPPVPIPSATLILGRDGPGGLEIFMVLRHKKSDFAPGALVFPGGKIDKNDRSKKLRKYCDGASNLDDDKLCWYVAAIRETFEECGILLARHNEVSDVISGKDLALLNHYRSLLNRGEISIIEFLEDENLTLACDLLTPFAHWIAPEHLPIRFETLFFFAEAPLDHIDKHDGTESVDTFWMTSKQALQAVETEKFYMLFPTRMNMIKLGENRTVSDAIAKAKLSKIVTIMPVIKRRKNGNVLSIPKGAGYRVTEELINI